MSRVCVVDDDPRVLQLLARILRDGGLQVDTADRGAQVLEYVESHRYDLILLDLGLPDMDGVTLLQILRVQHPETPVMVVSATDDSASRVRCLDVGACDFVGKPFDVSELLARVRAHLRPRFVETSAGRLRRGAVMLDLSRHSVVVANRTMALSTREFLLLRHLMSRAGEPCSREELMQTVRGYDLEADSNVVDVYVSRLRSKLPGRLIETIRNVGYCFMAA